MSIKRQAPTELTHENWDQDDTTEHEEMGTFKTAPKEVLEKRVIRTAKRRSQISGNESKNTVFSGFGGFNKIQPSSFDFLANLTNGGKPNNGTPTTKNDTTVSSSIFTNKSLSSSPSSGIFTMSGSTGFTTKPTLGKSTEGSIFGSSISSNTASTQLGFSGSKADSTVNDSLFKVPHTPAKDSGSKSNVTPDVSTSQVSSSVFGISSNASPNKSLFSSTSNNSTLFSSQAVSSTSTQPLNSATTTKADSNTAKADSNTAKADSNTTESSSKSEDEKEAKRLTYYSKLKGLNESVSDWIKKHVGETPLCILSPIFKDYERYLKEIQEEFNGGNSTKQVDEKAALKVSAEVKSSNEKSSTTATLTSSAVTKLEAPQNNNSDTTTKSSSFNFGINTSTTTTARTAGTGFSIGFNSSTTSTASSLFSLTTANANTPFSFGINNNGFAINTAKANTEKSEEAKDDDDEPPKVEFTPIVEENSVFDTKCKIFIKKDGNFIDKGVGTLYIKKIEESGKHQLLVRANTNLGNVLLNLVLSTSVPTQRMGKNNVMMVCIPTPDAKPPPVPILIRVKTTEEADELLSTLNKYKA